jgi:hypothetical protein
LRCLCDGVFEDPTGAVGGSPDADAGIEEVRACEGLEFEEEELGLKWADGMEEEVD